MKNDPTLKANSQKLRKQMTKEERHLWYDFLKQLNTTVYRQKVIGPYIADFYISNPKTVIELDGSQHYIDDGPAEDAARDQYLKQCGCQILRYANNQIRNNFSDVCTDILNKTKLN